MTIASPMPLFLISLLMLAFVQAGSAQGPSSPDSPISSPLTEAPTAEASPVGISQRYPRAATTGFSPSRTVGVSLRVSTGGLGLDLTIPVAARFAVRAGASFLSFDGTLVEQNIDVDAHITLQNAYAGIDFFPFRNSFRITPGFSFANRTTANASLSIPGGRTFSFGEGGTEISDPGDPVRGTAKFAFGRGLNPRLTAGWANAIPHRNTRISFPVELGFEYIAPPTAMLSIAGSACDPGPRAGTFSCMRPGGPGQRASGAKRAD